MSSELSKQSGARKFFMRFLYAGFLLLAFLFMVSSLMAREPQSSAQAVPQLQAATDAPATPMPVDTPLPTLTPLIHITEQAVAVVLFEEQTAAQAKATDAAVVANLTAQAGAGEQSRQNQITDHQVQLSSDSATSTAAADQVLAANTAEAAQTLQAVSLTATHEAHQAELKRLADESAAKSSGWSSLFDFIGWAVLVFVSSLSIAIAVPMFISRMSDNNVNNDEQQIIINEAVLVQRREAAQIEIEEANAIQERERALTTAHDLRKMRQRDAAGQPGFISATQRTATDDPRIAQLSEFLAECEEVLRDRRLEFPRFPPRNAFIGNKYTHTTHDWEKWKPILSGAGVICGNGRTMFADRFHSVADVRTAIEQKIIALPEILE